jgi:3-hydroxybutyryl-CoA dehydrogenase
MRNEIKDVLVVGYGVMGRGIALTFVRGGHRATVLSRDPARAADVPPGVTVVGALPETPPDLIVESIPEDIALKHALFEKLEAAYGAGPILASNTSSLPLDAMAAKLRAPERFVGIHYFQPPEALPLVELIRCAETADAVVERCRRALARNGQRAILLHRPIQGFLANRLQHAMMHEALCMIEDGYCSAEDVDDFCRNMFGPRMSVTGLIMQKDISGLQTTAKTHRELVPTFYHTRTPCALLQEMVARGERGISTGKGFYDWSGRDVAALKAKWADKVRRILAIVQEA